MGDLGDRAFVVYHDWVWKSNEARKRRYLDYINSYFGEGGDWDLRRDVTSAEGLRESLIYFMDYLLRRYGYPSSFVDLPDFPPRWWMPRLTEALTLANGKISPSAVFDATTGKRECECAWGDYKFGPVPYIRVEYAN